MMRQTYYRSALAMVLFVAACSPDAAQRLSTAESYFAKGDHAGARLELVNALAQDPANRQALLLNARNDVALGDGIGGERSVKLALAAGVAATATRPLLIESFVLQEKNREALALLGADATRDTASNTLLRARALWGLDRHDEAQRIVAAALKADPLALPIRLESGRMALLLRNYDLARNEADRVLAKRPDHLDALILRGEIAAATGEIRNGEAWFARAGRVAPKDRRAIGGLAAALGDVGELDKMAAVLEPALAQAPDDQRFILLKARLELARKNPAVAAEWLARSKDVRFDKTQRALMGEVAIALGRFDQAITALGPLVVAEPHAAAPRLLLARAQLGARDPAAAFETLLPIAGQSGVKRSATQPAASPAALLLLAEAAKGAGRPEAAALARRALFPDPRWLAEQIASGNQALLQQRWSNAVTVYDGLVTATGRRDATLRNNLAWSLFMNGSVERALIEAEAARRTAPKNASVADTLGWILWKSGKDPARGRSILSQAAALDPANATIRSHLAQAGG